MEVNDEYVDSNEKDTNTENDVLDDYDDYCYHHDGMLSLQVPKEKDINVAGVNVLEVQRSPDARGMTACDFVNAERRAGKLLRDGRRK
eukprot:5450895-Ditylum_brightwellii.AAC.1